MATWRRSAQRRHGSGKGRDEMSDLHGLDAHITGNWGEDSISEDEDGDINDDGGVHVHAEA